MYRNDRKVVTLCHMSILSARRKRFIAPSLKISETTFSVDLDQVGYESCLLVFRVLFL